MQTEISMIDLDFEVDQGIGSNANLGIIVLQTDETVEHELRQLTAVDGVALYHSRIPSGAEVTPETLSGMQDEIARSVSLLPEAVAFDVIAYGCTSASSIIGEAAVETLVQSVVPGAKVTNPITATKAALDALGAKRVAFVSPYIAEVSASLRNTLTDGGFEIVSAATFNESSDSVVARMTEASILAAIIKLGQQTPCDAVFVSCTNLRVANIIDQAEAVLGVPVISSNQAMAWHMLRLAGVNDSEQGVGALFRGA